MKSRVLIASAAVVAILAGCKDDTAVFPGGTPGVAAALAISQSAFTFRQADTASIAGQVTDSAGNPVAGSASIASCDASIVTVTDGTAPAGWNALATITAAGVGHSCITVTAGSLVDTALVDVGPYTLAITGPAAGTTNQTYVYHVTGLTSAGATVSAPFVRAWSTSSSNFKAASVSGVGDSVLVSSNATKGTFRVIVSALGGATGFLSVTIN